MTDLHTAAMELALEALSDFDYDKRMKSIAALRQALEQPAQSIEHCLWARNGNTRCPHAQPAQEPFEIEWPQYNEHAMGCGLEDRDEHCRYGAMRYGWDCAIEAVAQALPEIIYTPQAREPEPEHEQPAQQCDYRIKYDRGCYKCQSNFCPGNCKEPEQPAQQGWQPIETSPKDGTSILLASLTGRMASGAWIKEYEIWSWTYVMTEPTHWMPLPAAPTPPKENK